MIERESGLVLPAGVEVEPWRGGEQMKDVDTPISWLALQRDVRSWGPHLSALYRAFKGRV